MVFSSITFLLCFLPVTLITYYLAGNRLRNLVLLLTSLLFYTLGEGGYVLIMLLSIALNYVVGRQLDRIEGKQARTAVLAGGIGLNLVLLGYFKYGNWLAEIVAGRLGNTPVIARKSYIHPELLEFAGKPPTASRTRRLKLLRGTRWLSPAERGLLKFLS